MVSASVKASDCCVLASQATTSASVGIPAAHPEGIAVEMPIDGSCPNIIAAEVLILDSVPIGASVVAICACSCVMTLLSTSRQSFTSCAFAFVDPHVGAGTLLGVWMSSRGVGPSGVHSGWLELTLVAGGGQRGACWRCPLQLLSRTSACVAQSEFAW